MKIKTILVSALAMFALAACSNDEKNQGPTLEGDISMSVKLSEGVATRMAAENLVPDGEAVVFNKGYMFFVQNTIISKKVEVQTGNVSTGTVNSDGDEVVGYDDLIAGRRFTDVPASSNRVVFVGNTPAGVTIPPLATNIEDFLDNVIDIKTQTDAKGFVSNVSIYGAGSIVPVTGMAYDAEASFDVYPITARTQIKSLKIAEDATTNDYATITGGADERIVTSFKVKGIFVNYFIPDADLRGFTDPSDIITYTQVSLWTPQLIPSGTNHENYYSLDYQGVLYDFNNTNGIGASTGTGLAFTYKPNTGYAGWAYNIFTTQVPHIIVRLTDIYTIGNDGTDWDTTPVALGKDQYITIKGFRDENSALVTSFDKGYVYTMDEIPVKYSYLTDVPEMEDEIEVNVKISVMTWTEKKVTPDLP